MVFYWGTWTHRPPPPAVVPKAFVPSALVAPPGGSVVGTGSDFKAAWCPSLCWLPIFLFSFFVAVDDFFFLLSVLRSSTPARPL